MIKKLYKVTTATAEKGKYTPNFDSYMVSVKPTESADVASSKVKHEIVRNTEADNLLNEFVDEVQLVGHIDIE